MKPTLENLHIAINDVEIAAEDFENESDKEYAQTKVESALRELEKIKIEYRQKELKATIDKIFSDIEQDLMRLTLRQTGLRIGTKRLTNSIRDIANSRVELVRNKNNTCHTEYVFDSPGETTHFQPAYTTTEEKVIKTIAPNHHLRQGRTIPKVATTDSALNIVTSKKQNRIAVERTEYDPEGNIYILIRPSMHYIMESSQLIKHPVRETQRHTFAQRQRITVGTNFLLKNSPGRKTSPPDWDVIKTSMRRRSNTIIPLHENIEIGIIKHHLEDQMYQASQLLIWNGKYVIFPSKRYQEGLKAARQRKVGERILATGWMKNIHRYNIGQLRATKDTGTQYERELEPRTERTIQTESENPQTIATTEQHITPMEPETQHGPNTDQYNYQPQTEPAPVYQELPRIEPSTIYQELPQIEPSTIYQELPQYEPTPTYQQYTNVSYYENQTIQQYPYQTYHNQGYEYYTAATTETWPHPQ